MKKKRKLGRRLLGFLLTLAMVVGLMPGMGLKAYAATIDSSSTTWSEDSIIADDVEIYGKVTVTNNITLTIPKDKVLTVYGGIDIGSYTLTVEGYGWLHVHGQGGNNGNDVDEGNDRDGGEGGYGIKGNIIIDGAKVNVDGGTGGRGGMSFDEENPAGKGGNGGTGIIGNVTIKAGKIAVNGGYGGNGGMGHHSAGGTGGTGGTGVVGNVSVEGDGGLAIVRGGDGGEGGDGNEKGQDGETGRAVTGSITNTIDGSTAEESDDSWYWNNITDSKSTKRYVKVVAPFPLWVGGTRVTREIEDDITGGGAYKAIYDDDTKTLTLNNYSYDDSGYENSAIYCKDQNLNIFLVGNNTVTHQPVNGNSSAGITVENGDLTISGTGTLTSTGGDTSSDSFGIKVIGTSGGKLEIADKTTVTAKAGTTTGTSCGVNYSSELTVGGKLTAQGNSFALGKSNAAVAYTVQQNQAAVESGNYDGSGTTTTVINPDSTSQNSKYVYIAPAHSHIKDGTPIIFQEWNNTNSLPTTEGNYCLTTDVTLDNDGKWDVPAGTTNLCLNGHGIIYSGTDKNSVITVSDGATLNLYDCDVSTKHYITLDANGRGVSVSDTSSEGAIEVTGGYITGGTGATNDKYGGGVYINAGTFTMYGGTITGNTATRGGGVGVNYSNTQTSVFNMEGGTIKNNTAIVYGGGVFNFGSTINLKGGEISDNAAIGSSYGYGGGVSNSAGTFNMSGGTIKNNTANLFGGVRFDSGTFTMTGGEIVGNNATLSTGGVYAARPINISGKVTIKGNTVDGKESNIYLQNYDGYTNNPIVNVTDALDSTSSIGVTMYTPGVFTNSTGDNKAKDYLDNFTSDNPDYEVKVEGDELKLDLVHNHNFNYSATDDTITAVCNEDNCPLPEVEGKHVATLTINAPTMTTYGQTGEGISEKATITDVNNIKGEAVIKYFNATKSGESYTKAGEALTSAPKKAGNYVAEISLGEDTNEATAYVGYTIDSKSVTVTGITAENKIYDGSTDATLYYDSATINGKVDGDNLSYNTTATGTFSDKKVGNGKTVTISGLTLTGSDADNYTLASQPTTTANITPKSVTVTGITAQNKVYDGSTNATLNCEDATITEKVDNDDLSISTPTGSFLDKNVGNGKTVTITGLTLTGEDAANYILASQPADTTADITTKEVTVTGIIAENKIYDGSTGATLNHESATIQGKVDNDDLSYNADFATGAFSDKNVGEGKTVSISGLTLTGNDVANYKLASQPAATTANIIAKPVTVSGITANDKIYDGNTNATLVTTEAIFDGKLDGDTLSVSGTGTFDSSNVGKDKTVTISGLTLGGDSKDNYVLTPTGQQMTAQADIAQKSITGATVTLDKTQLTYNGQEQSVSVTGVTTSDGITLTADDYIVSGNTQTDKDDYQVTVTGKGNFTDDATTNWKIVDKAMTVKADNVTVTYDGEEHGIKVEVIDPASGAEVKYGTTEDTYDLDECPTVTNPGTLTVYYKVTAANYADYTGTAIVTVEKLPSTPADVTAINREYDGTEKPLVNVTGKATGGKMQYALGENATTAPADDLYDISIPTATDAGTYYVWFKVIGDEDHLDTEAESIEVKIDKAKGDTNTDDIFYVNVEGEDGEWTKGSSDSLQMTFKRSVVDSETFSHFKGILVDGKAVDASDYTAESGSVIIKLNPSFLETLTVGEHVLTAQFDDAADAEADFTVKEAVESAKDADIKPADTQADTQKTADEKIDSPKTGDETNPQLMLLVMLLAAIDMALVAFIKSKKKNNR